MSGLVFFETLERIDDDSDTTYTPFVSLDGYVGYRATNDDDVVYVYLNASGGSDDGWATVFACQGSQGDPTKDEALVHFVLFHGSHDGQR